MSVTPSPVGPNVVWVGTEPGEVWRSGNAGTSWEPTSRLEALPSSFEWSFPPRPDTHHVRWIACHPLDPDRLWATSPQQLRRFTVMQSACEVGRRT
jgi:hypothetical protein